MKKAILVFAAAIPTYLALGVLGLAPMRHCVTAKLPVSRDEAGRVVEISSRTICYWDSEGPLGKHPRVF
jgi:hypothetical protein